MVKPIKKIQLGKKGLSDEFIEQLKSFFISDRVVKVCVLRSACRNKEELRKFAEKIINKLGDKYKYRIVGYVLTIMRFRKNQK